MGKTPKKPPIAKARFSSIRPFVNFKYTGSDYQKRIIKKIYEETEGMRSQPHTLLKTKSKKNLGVAIQAAGFAPGTKWDRYIKAVPILTNGVPNTRAKVSRKGTVIVYGEFHSQEYIPFNLSALAKGGKEYVDRLLKGRSKKETYTVAAGAHFIDRELEREFVGPYVAKLMARYEKGTPGAKKHGSNWRQWLHGANAVTAKNQTKKDEYFREGSKRRKKARADNKKAKKAAAKKGR